MNTFRLINEPLFLSDPKSRVTSVAWVQWFASLQVSQSTSSGSAVWGAITGNLADQIDLQSALDSLTAAINNKASKTVGSYVLKGNGTGGFSQAVSGLDIITSPFLQSLLQGLKITYRTNTTIYVSAGSIEINDKICYINNYIYLSAPTDTSKTYYLYVKAPTAGYTLSSACFSFALTAPAWNNNFGAYYEAGSSTNRYLGSIYLDSSGHIDTNKVFPSDETFYDIKTYIDSAILATGYNYIETTPASDETVTAESITITGKTMHHSGTTLAPTLTINGDSVSVTASADQPVYTFTYTSALAVGANVFAIESDNGVVVDKTLTITRTAVAPSCVLTHATYLKAGAYTITMTTDYDLASTPTLSADTGSLGTFAGSGKVWTATLTITSQNGTGTFSSATMVGSGGTGHTINSGATYYVDTVAPTIGAANFSTTLWHYETGSMTCTVAMGESTTGFTGTVDLSTFGLSASYALSPSGNNMVATFTPARVNAGPAYSGAINVTDRSGNAATPKAQSDNQLQVIAYRVVPQNLTFAAYSAVSGALAGGATFTTDANSIVSWGTGQTNSGTLVYTTDYTVDDHNKIHLDETKWATTIAANALGLLNVDVLEN
jgi:hypothetical protein